MPRPPKQYGVLLSCAPMDRDDIDRQVDGPFATRAEATSYGISATRSGIEYEVMSRVRNNDPWRSLRHESIADVIRRRWQ